MKRRKKAKGVIMPGTPDTKLPLKPDANPDHIAPAPQQVPVPKTEPLKQDPGTLPGIPVKEES